VLNNWRSGVLALCLITGDQGPGVVILCSITGDQGWSFCAQ
jgi:hypothetical protein